jgi:hypothetical protein
MGADDPDIDLTKFEFPTDKLTIKDLRRLYPGRLDGRALSVDNPFKEGSIYEKLDDLLSCERMQAVHTYDQVRRNYREFGVYGEELEEARQELADLYIKFGIASGPAHAQELARGIERQAVQQAERHGCKSR